MCILALDGEIGSIVFFAVFYAKQFVCLYPIVKMKYWVSLLECILEIVISIVLLELNVIDDVAWV